MRTRTSRIKMHDEILDQFMENDDDMRLKVWASDVERRDVYLMTKKTSPSWKKVIVHKTLEVENEHE